MLIAQMKTPGHAGSGVKGGNKGNCKAHCFRLGANSQMPTLNANAEGVS